MKLKGNKKVLSFVMILALCFAYILPISVFAESIEGIVDNGSSITAPSGGEANSGESTTGGEANSGESTTGGEANSGESTTGGETNSGESTTGGETGSGESTPSDEVGSGDGVLNLKPGFPESDVDPGFSVPVEGVSEDAIELATTSLEAIIEEQVAKEIEPISLKSTVSNGGVEINAGETLNPLLPIEVKVSFGISDDNLENLKEGDYSIFDLGLDTLKLTDSDKFPLPIIIDLDKATGTTLEIGKLLIEDGKAKLVYNDGLQNTDVTDVEAHFAISLSLDESLGGEGDESIVVKILGKEYKINFKKPVKATLAKEGTFIASTGAISWTLTVTPNENLNTLEGYILTDKLPAEVTYVASSFKVNGKSVAEESLSYEEPNLTYTFGDVNVSEPVIITFDTKVNDLYKDTTIKNEATIKNTTSNDKSDATAEVKIKPQLIEKSGTIVENDDHSINWTIKVNKSEFNLKNAVVTDELSEYLTVSEGSIKVNKNPISNDSTKKPYYTLDGNVLNIHLGDITDMQTITFNTAVKKSFAEFDKENISNTATLTWDSSDKGVSSTATVGVGTSSITKVGKGYDRSTHMITWDVNVNPKNLSIGNAIVKDCFVYREDGEMVRSSNQEILNAMRTSGISTKGLPDEGFARDQKFVSDSLTNIGKASTQNITVNGENLTVDIFTVTLGDINQSTSFSFKSEVMAKAYYGSNLGGTGDNAKMANHVKLGFVKENGQFSASAKGSQLIMSHMIEKTVLSNDETPKYNYETRSTTWQIHVNSNKMKVTNAVVTDTLPTYCEVSGDSFFEVYEGGDRYAINGTEKTMRLGEKLTSFEIDSLLTAEVITGKDGKQTVVFKFSEEIDKGYVIQLTTKITEEGAQKLFLDNGQKNIWNKAEITGDEISGAPFDWEDFNIENTIIGKSGKANPNDEVITWTITANSNSIQLTTDGSLDKAYIVDDLTDKGIEPVYKNGKIVARAYEMQINQNGKYEIKAEVPEDVMNTNLTYNDNILRFQLPKANGFYRLEFDTEIIDTSRTEITNSASLEGVVKTQSTSNSAVKVSDVFGGGSASLLGKITVVKSKSGDNSVMLEGATFALIKENQTIDTKTTDELGKIEFKRLKKGTYTVKEITPPEGYDFGEIIERTVTIDTKNPNEKNVTVKFENPVKKSEPSNPGTGGGGGNSGGGGGGNTSTPEVNIPDEGVPAGPAPTDEIVIEDEKLPAGPIAMDPEIIITDEPVPMGPASLPNTGAIPLSFILGSGALLIALGLALKKKQELTK